MQIVIKIPKKLYDRYKEKDHIKPCDIDEWEKAIDKCIILPKGHGRLIDANNITFSEFFDAGDYAQAMRVIYNAPTIIEADKESD